MIHQGRSEDAWVQDFISFIAWPANFGIDMTMRKYRTNHFNPYDETQLETFSQLSASYLWDTTFFMQIIMVIALPEMFFWYVVSKSSFIDEEASAIRGYDVPRSGIPMLLARSC